MSKETISRAVLTTDGRVLIEQPDSSYWPAESRTDCQRLDRMSEEDVEQAAAEEMAELGVASDWAERSRLIHPRPRERITMRLDPEILG